MRKAIAILAVLMIATGFCVGLTHADAPEQPAPKVVLPTRINGNVELAAASTYGAGTWDNPYIIDGTIDGSLTDYALYVGNTTDFFRIQNMTITDTAGPANWWFYTASSIHLYHVINCNITNNTMITPDTYGILLSNTSSNITIWDNVIYNASLRGIALTDTDNCDIGNNIIYGNCTTNFGMTFDDLSDNQVVTNNTIYQTVWAGIGFNDSWTVNMTDNHIYGYIAPPPDDPAPIPIYGIFAYHSAYMDVFSNDIINTSYAICFVGTIALEMTDIECEQNRISASSNGIVAMYTNNLTVYANVIESDEPWLVGWMANGIAFGAHTNDTDVQDNYVSDYQTGINITTDCRNITLWDNHIFDNAYNAFDDNLAVLVNWDNGALGNWWDDWTTPDANDDDIVDVARVIDGLGANQDQYPQVNTPAWVPPGGGGGSSGGDDEELPPVEDENDTFAGGNWFDFDIKLTWMFWPGVAMMLIGIAKFPIPYLGTIRPKMWLALGAVVIVMSFLI